jgi:prophage regulatory protein
MDAEIQFLRLPEVLKRLGISRSTLYARLNPSSKYFDSTFPKQLKLFPSLERSSVVWISHEIIDWQKQQADKR